ncbi:MAG TPA: acetyl-CoA C-acyltransferase [Saprospiraceae bacterium]|nr:acetyl-CoA C-acyltransferase [Saprospiraceae bacterium]
MQEVYIVGIARTPMGSFGGSLMSLSAVQLGSIAIKAALERANVAAKDVQEVYFGNVLSANLGQAPARQAAISAGIPYSANCTTVNKVCASGMKSISLAAQSIMLGYSDIVVCGGMESMSNIPYYIPNARWGMKYGSSEIIDGLQKDGLTDAYGKMAMGVCADATAKKYSIGRDEQDAFTVQSYQRSAQATESGKFVNEICPVTIPTKKGDPIVISEDEEFKKVDFSKISGLKPVFSADGTVTAANASTMNDGASALILVSEKKLKELNLKPIARIAGFADAEQEPEWFTTAPTLAAPLAAKRAGKSMAEIDFFEVNEAFAVVALAFSKVLEIPQDKLNLNGGAVSLGHPLGSSGSRIVCTLSQILNQQNGKFGLAAICNGGGGATALVVESIKS